jgi:zinc finger protein
LSGESEELTLVLDDPAGQSFIENPSAPNKDPQLKISYYDRTPEQNEALGLQPQEPEAEPNWKEEVLTFPSNCSECHGPVECRMKVMDIPYFKEVVIMSAVCDACGYKSNEVKAAGDTGKHGTKISLTVSDADDLSRDVLKSESASLSIPEIELSMEHGTLGGKFTTIEGLLLNVYDELMDKTPFAHGDASTTNPQYGRFKAFMQSLQECLELKRPFTVVIDDPMSNSYIQNLCAPDPDPALTTETYERSWEQNEFLGLNDIDIQSHDGSDVAMDDE